MGKDQPFVRLFLQLPASLDNHTALAAFRRFPLTVRPPRDRARGYCRLCRGAPARPA
jgi:hypothetical protein